MESVYGRTVGVVCLNWSELDFLGDRHHAVRLWVKWRFSGCRVCNSHFLFACPTGFNYSRERKERVSKRGKRESEMKIKTDSFTHSIFIQLFDSGSSKGLGSVLLCRYYLSKWVSYLESERGAYWMREECLKASSTLIFQSTSTLFLELNELDLCGDRKEIRLNGGGSGNNRKVVTFLVSSIGSMIFNRLLLLWPLNRSVYIACILVALGWTHERL